MGFVANHPPSVSMTGGAGTAGAQALTAALADFPEVVYSSLDVLDNPQLARLAKACQLVKQAAQDTLTERVDR